MRDVLKKLIKFHGHEEQDLVKLSGVTQPTINRILNARHASARSDTVEKLAEAYGLTGSHIRGDIPIDYLNNANDFNDKEKVSGKFKAKEEKSAYQFNAKKLLSEHERMSLELRIIGRVETLSDENLVFINNYIDKTEKLKNK